MAQMKKKLLKDVDIETLYSMRNKGRTNKEIAEAFGVSYATIYNMLGAMPKYKFNTSINEMFDATISEYDKHITFMDRVTGTTYTISYDLVDKLYNTVHQIVEEEKENMENTNDSYKPIKKICVVCGNEFNISPSEQKFYKERGMQLPKRCIDCRSSRNEMIKFVCCDCGEEFEMSQSNIDFYKQNNLFVPKRCPKCREEKHKRIKMREVRNAEATEDKDYTFED